MEMTTWEGGMAPVFATPLKMFLLIQVDHSCILTSNICFPLYWSTAERTHTRKGGMCVLWGYLKEQNIATKVVVLFPTRKVLCLAGPVSNCWRPGTKPYCGVPTAFCRHFELPYSEEAAVRHGPLRCHLMMMSSPGAASIPVTFA